MDPEYDDRCNTLLKDENFLTFLKHQVKGVFENFDCDHSPQTHVCFLCITKFFKGSEFKDYFFDLYEWFKESKFKLHNLQSGLSFYPDNLIDCIQINWRYIIVKESQYFCSSWLDGIVQCDDLYDSYSIFKSLCLNEHLETLQWFCRGFTPYFRLSKTEQQDIFMDICKQNPTKNNRTYDILSYLFSLYSFKELDVHVNNEEAFRWACANNHDTLVQFLLELTEDQKIDIKIENEYAFRISCNNGFVKIVKLLLKVKDDRKIINNHNFQYSLELACQNGHYEVVKLLLELDDERKISTEIKQGKCLKMAYENKHFKIMKLLLD